MDLNIKSGVAIHTWQTRRSTSLVMGLQLDIMIVLGSVQFLTLAWLLESIPNPTCCQVPSDHYYH
jgi:hypothetical protein